MNETKDTMMRYLNKMNNENPERNVEKEVNEMQDLEKLMAGITVELSNLEKIRLWIGVINIVQLEKDMRFGGKIP
jgi:hypothetical protein